MADPPGPPETHPAGCLCGPCFRLCLSDDPPWWAPYRLHATHHPEDADRMREHEELVARGMWLARQALPVADPPTLADALDECFESLANRCEVIE